MNLDPSLLDDAVAYADRWIEYRHKTYWVPGIAVAIRHGDRLLLDATYGVSQVEPEVALTRDHVFRLASQSKMVTAVAVLQLVEQQRLRLDDRVTQHLHWVPNGEHDIGRVTLRELLQHAGGLRREGNVGEVWQFTQGFPDSDAIRATLQNDAPTYDANRWFKYSNLGYAVLGLLIEVVSGTPYDDYVQQRIFTPLGLHDTAADVAEYPDERLVTGYSNTAYGLDRRPLPNPPTHGFSPAAGLCSTASDLSRFTQALFYGEPGLLDEASKREAFHGTWEPTYEQDRYGLGFITKQIGEHSLVGHDGMFPGQLSATLIDPVHQLSVVVLTNTIDAPASDIATGVYELMQFSLQQSAADEARRKSLDRYTGRFFSLFGAEDVVRLGTSLFSFDPESAHPTQLPTHLEVADDDRLRIALSNGYGGQGEYLQYERDRNGVAIRVVAGNDSEYPFEQYLEALNAIPLPEDDRSNEESPTEDGLH